MTKLDPSLVLTTLIAVWNLFGLPVLLEAVAIVATRRAGAGVQTDPAQVVRRVGLINYGLALWGLTTVVSELWAYRVMGIFPANPIEGFHGSLLMIAADVPIGFGLRRLWRGWRWAAIVLTLVRLGLKILLNSLTWPYGLQVDPTEWPRVVVSNVLPPVLVVVLLLPSTARAFRKSTDRAPPRWVAILVLLLLVVLGSVVVTDAVDWTIRAAMGEV
jgi:hypothetical protein